MRIPILCLLVAAGMQVLPAQSVTLSAGSGSGLPGSTVSVPITLTSAGGAQPTALQWTLTPSPGASVAGFTVNVGAAATAAGKQLICNGGICAVFGLNSTPIANGTVATVDVQIAAGASGSISVALSGVVASGGDGGGTAIPASGTNGTITITAPAVGLAGLSCTPSSFTAAGSSVCTVTLTGTTASPVNVNLSSNNAAVTVPASIPIGAGQSSAQFTASVGTITADATATITAGLGGVTRTANLTLTAPAVLTGLNCAPGSLTNNQSANCTVTLSKASVGATVINLSDNSAQLTTPASVSVSNGQSTAQFTATAGTISASQTVTVTATQGAVVRTAQINLVAPAGLSGLNCTPTTFATSGSSVCTVTLSGAAATAVTVNLSSNNATVTVPASIPIGAGQSSAQFTASVGAITADATATITASLNGGTQAANLTLTAPAVLTGLSCAPGSLTNNQSANCTVTLSKASVGATVVNLSDNSAQLTTPASVSVSNGQSTAQFTATAGTISASQTATVTATQGAVVRTAQINLVAAAGLSGLSCTPSTFSAAGTSVCTVTLSAAATSPVNVNLSSNNATVTVPASIPIGAGQSSAQFAATVGAITADATAAITASLNGGTQTANLTLTSAAALSTLTCSPGSLGSNQIAMCTVTLSKASVGVTQVALSDNSDQLNTPATVSFGNGEATAQFPVTTGTVTAAQTVTVTATHGAIVRTAQVSLVAPAPSGLSGLTCAPLALSSGGSTLCTVTLASAAVQAQTINLSGNHDAVAVPPSALIPAGQSSAQFRLNAGDIAASATFTLTAALNEASLTIQIALTGQALELSSLSCAPASLLSNQSSTCTVSLNRAAPSPLSVVVASNQPNLTVPDRVMIPQNAVSGSFTATAGTVSAAQAAQVTAAYNGKQVAATIQLQAQAVQPSLQSLTCSAALSPGAIGSCTVVFSGPIANSGELRISASHTALQMPSSWVPAEGVTSVTFPIQAAPTQLTQAVEVVVTWRETQQLTQTVEVGSASPLQLDTPPAVFTRVGREVGFEAFTRGGTVGALTSAESLPAGASFQSSRFHWTPDSDAVGEHTVTIRATDMSGLTRTASVRIVVRAAAAQIQQLENPAGKTPSEVCSANSYMSLIGTGFALSDPAHADGAQLPTTLGGVRVRIGGTHVPLLHVQDDLVHFQCPALPDGTPVDIVMEYEAAPGSVAMAPALRARISSTSPGIYLLEGTQAAAVDAATGKVAGPPTQTYPTHPVAPGGDLVIYGNGMGPSNLNLPLGEPAPLDPLAVALATVLVDFGNGSKVPASWAGLTPGYVGLFQINVRVPFGVPLGAAVPVTLELQLPGGPVVRSNTATVAIAAQ